MFILCCNQVRDCAPYLLRTGKRIRFRADRTAEKSLEGDDATRQIDVLIRNGAADG